MQREVYLGRGRKGSIREQNRKRERTDWNESLHRRHGNILVDREESARESDCKNREQSKKRDAKQTGVTDWKTYNWQRSVVDICWCRRDILKQRKKRQYQGAKMGARNGRIETRMGIKGMEICCWQERRNRPARAKARTGSKAGSGKREAKQTGVTDGKTWNWQRSVVDICWCNERYT
jgi:hypothetical protein